MRIANKMAAGTALIAMLISVVAASIAICVCPSGAMRPAHACRACDPGDAAGPRLVRGGCCTFTSVAVPPVVAASSVTLVKPAPVALFVATLGALAIDAPIAMPRSRSGSVPPDRAPTPTFDSSVLRL
jgi:hypothetical protein